MPPVCACTCTYAQCFLQPATQVRGFNPAKNDFLFERRLSDHVFDIVSEFSQGKPSLIFCR